MDYKTNIGRLFVRDFAVSMFSHFSQICRFPAIYGTTATSWKTVANFLCTATPQTEPRRQG